jgi:hypothetical protein
MGLEGVVGMLSVLDDTSGVLQVGEPFQVQTLVAQAAIEGFRDAISCWLANLAEVQLDLILVCRFVQ